MVDERIEDITGGELTELDVADLLVILDASDTTDDPQGTVKRIAYQNVGKLPLSNESAGFTAVRNTHHRVTVGTAARTVTMPSAGLLDGDRIRITVASQGTAVGSFAQAPGHAVGFANPTSINGASYTGTTTGKWSLWLTGESLTLEWDATNSTWWVIEDGRIAHRCSAKMSANITTNTAATWKDADLDTLIAIDIGNLLDAPNGRFNIKRANDYSISVKVSPNGAVTDQKYYEAGFGTTSVTPLIFAGNRQSAATSSALLATMLPTVQYSLASGNTLFVMFKAEEANMGALASASDGVATFGTLQENLR